jgi:hypothetical protein
MSRKDTAEDEAPRRQEPKPEADYQCAANFCPARATIFDTVAGPPRNGRCRYHDGAAPSQWPAVTALLNRTQSIEETDDGLAELGLAVRVAKPYQPPLPSVPNESPQEILARLRALLSTPKNPDAWWHKLIQRWHDGEVLLPIQQSAARSAWLKSGSPSEWAPPHPSAHVESESAREAALETLAMQMQEDPA